MAQSVVILVAAPDTGLRHSLAFALESDGYKASAYPYAADAFASENADEAVCAVIDDDAIEDWHKAHDQVRLFARPVILLVSIFRTAPELPLVRPLIKPFLGEPLLEAVRNAVAGLL